MDPSRGVWRTAGFYDLTAAEDLLDLLEFHGVGEREMTVTRDGQFVVRWRVAR